MKKTAIALLALMGVAGFARDIKVNIRTTPAADGYLCGKKGEIPNQVCSTALEATKYRSINSIMIGHIWRGSFKGVLEFPLPEEIKEIKQATLTLYTLGKTGCYERKAGGGPEVEMYYYFSPAANGKVELSDDKIGTKAAVTPLKSGDKVPQHKPLKVDVTDIVTKAAAARSEWLGLRLETKEESNSAWKFVAAENPNNKNEKMSPTLTIVYVKTAPATQK